MVTARRQHRPCAAVLRVLAHYGGYLLIGLGAAMPAAADQAMVAEAVTRATAAVRAGSVTTAIDAWSLAEQRAATTGDTAARMEVLLRRAESYQALGRLTLAAKDLDTCRKLAIAAGDAPRQALASGMLGSLRLSAGETEEDGADSPGALLKESLDLAERHALPKVEASTLVNLGLLNVVHHRPAAALGYFNRALAAANHLGEAALLATVQINRARFAAAAGRPELASPALDAAGAALDQLEPTPEKARLRLAWAVALLHQSSLEARPEPARLHRVSAGLQEAADLARRFDDRRTLSFAYGYLGRVAETRQRYGEALQQTHAALAVAGQTGEPALLYQWNWQTGRLHAATGATDPAIAAYQRAIALLKDIRFAADQAPDALGESFRETSGQLYRQLADLLLRRAATAQSPGSGEKDVRDALEVMEQFKAAELEDYYQDTCVAELKSKQHQIEPLPAQTAVLYPILLPDRTELIVTIGQTVWRTPVPAGAKEVERQTRDLRRLLEDAATQEYRRPAQQLYDWLIKPIQSKLAEYGVTTLLLVPDGPLYSIPLAALHDGEHFLVQRYATAVLPGLTLLDPQSISRQQVSVLVAALTRSGPDAAGAPNLRTEIQTIRTLFSSEVLRDQQFGFATLRAALARRPYSIVHIASHTQFTGKAETSSLETFNGGKLTMNDLEKLIKLSRFREVPVELLILSACQTASGDDRSAFGLTGVAIKAGARSAIGSLWFTDDAASAALMEEFYKALKNTALSKAEALRHAQLELMQQRGFDHPSYWSPFLVIGNWL